MLNSLLFSIERMLAVAKKEFLHILRDKRSLAVVILAPVAMLLLYGYAVTFDIKSIDMGIVDGDRSSLSRKLVNGFFSSGYFELYGLGDNDMGKNIKALRSGKVKLILAIPNGFSRDLKRGQETKVQVLADGSDSNTTAVALGYAGTIVSVFSGKVMLDAVEVRGYSTKNLPSIEPEPRVWYNPNLRSTNFIVPGLIAIIMMLMAALLTSLTIVREKERGTFEQLISTPIKPFELIMGKLFPYILIGLFDVAVIVILGTLWFKVPFMGSIITLLIFSLAFIFCALGLGLFISSVAKSQETAVMGTLFATALPSVLLSGFVFPIDSMPWVVKIVTFIVPARHFLTALRSIFLKADAGIAVLQFELMYLLVFGMVFMGISILRFRKHLG